MDNGSITNRSIFIDKSSPVPYYHQLKLFIISEVESGRILPTEKIPSETELCERFDISRTVVRQAIKELQNEGYLTTEKGKGTFVSRPKIVGGLVQSLTGFHEDMARRGFTVSTDILAHEVQNAPPRAAEPLGIETGTPVIVISRIRRLNGEPSVYVTTYIPKEICPGLVDEDLSNKSLYAVLEGKYGLEIHRGHRYIGVSLSNEYEARLLNIEVGSPLIELDSTSFLEDGRPLEYFHALHRGDRTRFEVELVRIKE